MSDWRPLGQAKSRVSVCCACCSDQVSNSVIFHDVVRCKIRIFRLSSGRRAIRGGRQRRPVRGLIAHLGQLNSAAIRSERRLAQALLDAEKAKTVQKKAKRCDVSPAVTGRRRLSGRSACVRSGSVVERFVRVSGTVPLLADRNGQNRN